ncbi:MAG: hypothetical protein J0I09_07965 [Sphingobacteriia bacterium]|nr:hypothetical protein [Sphingobacteriia bacterium]
MSTISLGSCWPGKQLPAPAYLRVHKQEQEGTGKLRLDGYYSNISDSLYPGNKYTAVDPLLFTANHKVHVVHGSYTHQDSAVFTCNYYKKLTSRDFGDYLVEGNKISAFAPVAVAIAGGSLYFVYYLNFTGTISGHLIKDWKAVPPFPKRIKKNDMDEPQNNGIFKAHDFAFIQVPADSLACLSVP